MYPSEFSLKKIIKQNNSDIQHYIWCHMRILTRHMMRLYKSHRRKWFMTLNHKYFHKKDPSISNENCSSC